MPVKKLLWQVNSHPMRSTILHMNQQHLFGFRVRRQQAIHPSSYTGTMSSCSTEDLERCQWRNCCYKTRFWGQFHVLTSGYSSMSKWYITNVLGKLAASLHITGGKIFVIFTIWLWCYTQMTARTSVLPVALRVSKEHLELTIPPHITDGGVLQLHTKEGAT